MTNKSTKALESILAQIPSHGWTAQAIEQGAKTAKISVSDIRRFFPNGISDVVAAFHQSIDDAMLDAIKKNRRFAAMRVRDKITFAIHARLEAIAPHREAMQRLLAWGIMPRHIGASAKYIWDAADSIWDAAGDTSTDYNRYTKRLLLIAVMKSTLSFWLNDTSRGHAETWAFLDRRIADVMKIGKGISVAKTVGITDIVSFVRGRLAA